MQWMGTPYFERTMHELNAENVYGLAHWPFDSSSHGQNLSKRDETWAEFSTLDLTVLVEAIQLYSFCETA